MKNSRYDAILANAQRNDSELYERLLAAKYPEVAARKQKDLQRQEIQMRQKIMQRNLLMAVADAMSRQGVTQADLAQRLGVTQATVSRFLNRGANPRLSSLIHVLDELQLQIKVSSVKI